MQKDKAIQIVKILDAIIQLQGVVKILDTFYKAFYLYTVPKDDGHYYLHGSLNLGGTVSGRMSHSDPNLGNLPSNSKYAKYVKKCFRAPPGWLFVGADFSSLEDRISALTTKDPNKLKVYTDGYDGHSLRAYGYFGKHMPDITKELETVRNANRVFKITHDNGEVEYVNETDPRVSQLLDK